MAHDVFISYSSIDKALAEAVCAAIEAEAVGAWMAPRDIHPGQNYGEAIIEAINSSKVMIVVFSTNSNNSNQVLREVERAASKGVAIVPFRIEDLLPSKSMEYFLSGQHWMDAFAEPREAQIATLAKVIGASVAAAAAGDSAAAVAHLTAAAGPGPALHAAAHRAARKKLVRYAAAAAMLVLAATGGAVWWLARPVKLEASHIAVLPFRNLDQDEKIDRLSLQMPIALNTQLSRTASLFVVPLGSVLNFKDKSMPEIARALGVGTLVEGSYSHSGQDLSVHVSIIDSNRNNYLWSEPFEALLGDIRSLVDRMVPKVTEALRIRFEAKADGDLVGTRNSEAYDLYLRGLVLGLDITQENNESAVQLLKKALTLDRAFAQAHAALADAYVTKFYWNFSNDPSWLDLAEKSAREALDRDSSLAEAHYALAYALEGKGQRAAAARGYFESLRVGPHYVPALSSAARYAFYMADFERALAALDTIERIDPTNNVHVRRAMCFYFAGNASEAKRENLEAEKQARGVDQLTLVAFTYVWLKDLEAAERILRRLEKEQPGALSLSEIRAWIYTARNQIPQAQEQIDIIAKRPTYGIADEIATLYAIRGEREKAIEWLAKAVQAGAPNYAWYRSDFFKSVRGDPRYEAILRQLTDEYKSVRPEQMPL